MQKYKIAQRTTHNAQSPTTMARICYLWHGISRCWPCYFTGAARILPEASPWAKI